jgi:glycerophosphoryl diester phosphodiesterase
MTLVLFLACTAQAPAVVAHRGLGVPDAEENAPDHLAAAFAAGFGAELDLRLDGAGCAGDPSRAGEDGCFDLGHSAPNGHTLAEAVAALDALDADAAGPTLVLDIVDDPDRAVSLHLFDYLAAALPGTLPGSTPILVQSSSLASLAMLAAQRDTLPPDLDLRLAVTYFVDPEFTVPDYVDVVVTNVAELPETPLPVPVAVFGVASQSSVKAALYAESDVDWVITDMPTRVAALLPEP